MGNWIRHTIEAKNIKNLDIFTDDVLDFNKIIPEPCSEKECPPEYLFTEDNDENISPSETKPWFNWAKWRKEHWGTYANADGTDIETNRNDMIIFDTKNSIPYPILTKISEMMTDIEVTHTCENLDAIYPPVLMTKWTNGVMASADEAIFEWDMTPNAKTDGKYGSFMPVSVNI